MEAMKEAILNIEDDAGLIELLNEKIQERGFQTASVSSAVEAFDWLNNQMPALIVLDYTLPDMNGKEFIAALMAKFKSIPPFILATGQGDERIAVEMMKLGARDYIVKDSNFLELMPIVISNVFKEVQNENKIKQIEQDLIESNQFNKQIIASAQEGIVVYDGDLKCQTWNPFMENLTGIQASEVVGKFALDIYPDLGETGVIANIKNALQGIVGSDIEFLYNYPASGRTGWISDRISILRNVDNEIVGAISTVRDITEHKIAEKEQNKSRENFIDLFDNAPVGYHEIDTEGRIVRMNQTELNMLGYTIEEQIGQYVWKNTANELVSCKFTKEKLSGHSIPVKPFGREFRRKDGSTFPVSVQDKVLRDKDGNITGIRSTIQDISEQKKIENELKNTQEDFKDLFDNAPVGYHELDAEGRVVRINKTELKLLGYTEQEVIGEYIWKFGPPDSKSEQQTKEKLKGQNIRLNSFESILETKDGLICPILVQDKILRDANGNITGIRSTIQDITDIRNAEYELNKSREDFKDLFENAPVGYHELDAEGKIVRMNQTELNMLGYTSEELIGQYIWEIAHNKLKTRKEVQEKLQGNPNSSASFETILISKDGLEYSISILDKIIRDREGNITGIRTTIQDITDRKKAEKEIRRIGEHYQALIEKAPDGIVLLDSEGNFKFVSPAARAIFGFDLSDKMNHHPMDVTYPEDKELVMKNMELLKANPAFVPTFEHRYYNKNGSCIWVESTFTNMLADPSVEAIVINFRDVTERKLIEEELRESEERYKSISENSNSAIFIINESCKIEWVNQYVLNFGGYSLEQVLSAESFVTFLAPDSVEFATTNFGKLISGEEYVNQYHLSIVLNSGEIRLFDKFMTHFIDRYGKLKVIVIMSDITERNKAENALKQSKTVLNKLLYANTEFIDSSSEGINYTKMTNTLLEISGAKYGTFNLLNENASEYKTVAVSGLGDILSKVKSIFGYDLLNRNWKSDPVKEEKIKNNVITKYDTIHELAKNSLPKAVRVLIEKTFSIGETYVVKITKKDILIGDFVLIFTKGNSIQNTEIVELFANQIALYIDREKADASLRNSEEKYRYLFANNPQPMYIYDLETLFFLEVNQAAIDHYGYSIDEFLAMKITDIRPKEDIPALLIDAQDDAQKHKLAGEWRHVKKDGKIINVDITTVSIISNGRKARHVLVQDITLRKKTENALQESEDKYRTMIEYSNDLIWALDSEGNFTFMNKMGKNTTGLVFEEWFGKSFVPLIIPEDLPMLNNVFQKTMAGENCTYELRFKKEDESILTISVNTSPIYNNGKIDGVVSFGRDITERKVAEEALRASEELYRNLVQRIPDGVYKSTNEGRFVDVNPSLVQMLGYESKEELMGIDIKTQLYFDEADRESLVLEEMHEETGVYQLKKKDGSAIWIEDHGWYNVDENGNVIYHEGVLRDITERKLSELALQEKMDELLRFHNLTIDRELMMIELKNEINKILVSSGQPLKYKIVE